MPQVTTQTLQKIKDIKIMNYEVDILAVGDETKCKSGDAIALRFGEFDGDLTKQYVVVIDGGFEGSGDKLVNRIIKEYGTYYVDLVISTHPDSDHINGLSVILEKLTVGELWIHTPWNLSEDIKNLAENRNLEVLSTDKRRKLIKSLQAAYDLEKLAIQKKINVVEPFEGTSKFNNVVHVLGPSLDYYYELVSGIDGSKQSLIKSSMTKVKNLIIETWNKDELTDPDENAVNSRNNSSVITLLQLDKAFLFVGDSGVQALTKAVDYAESKSYDLTSKIIYQQIPHHGSKRNLGPTLLNRIVGPILDEGKKTSKIAIISAAPNHPKHPSQRVRNALIRRGARVAETLGLDHCYQSEGLTTRPGWVPITFAEYRKFYEEE